MRITSNSYMDSLSESEMQLFSEQKKHACSVYHLNGQRITIPFDREDLLSVLMKMERYMPDCNSLNCLDDAKRPENRNRAFILWNTIWEEQANLEALVRLKSPHDNLFTIEFIAEDEVPFHRIVIHRMDEFYPLIMDRRRLKRESCRRNQERERDHMLRVQQFRKTIRDFLIGLDVTMAGHSMFLKQAFVQDRIRSLVPGCFKNYGRCCDIAMYCYAALLLGYMDTKVWRKSWGEFNDDVNPNVFGDTSLLQNALWLHSRIISNDNALKKMVGYTSVPCLKVTGMV